MSKFKVGDLVRVISSTYEPSDETAAMVGQMCKVKELHLGRYGVYTPDKSDYWFFNEEDLEREKTMDNLQVGDILVDKYSDERKVLGICGYVYFLSWVNKFESVSDSNWTIEQIKADFNLKTDEPEEPTPTNMTLEEIEEALGKKINIVDSKG